MARKTKKDPVEGFDDIPSDRSEAEKKEQAVRARNRKVRIEGTKFEKMLQWACLAYRRDGIAEIAKIPEARRVVGRTGNRSSLMICANAGKAHPDFMGTLAPDGKSIVFEAKHTDKNKIQQNAVSEFQDELLTSHQMMGAACFVVVSFQFKEFFRIPYSFWTDMKAQVKRKYLLPTDEAIQGFRIPLEVCLMAANDDEEPKPVEVVWFLPKRI